MARQNRTVGITIFISCIIGFIIYAWFLLVSDWKEIILQLTVLVAVAGMFGVLAWIGLVMATTTHSNKNVDDNRSESEEDSN